MIRGIHYFSAEVKPKLMSSQGAALRLSQMNRKNQIITINRKNPESCVDEKIIHVHAAAACAWIWYIYFFIYSSSTQASGFVCDREKLYRLEWMALPATFVPIQADREIIKIRMVEVSFKL